MSGKNQKKYYNKRKKGVSVSANESAAVNLKNPSDATSENKSEKNKIPPRSPLFDKDNIYEIFARLFLIAMSIIFPLAIGSEKYANVTHFKNMAFYLIAAAAFCSIIITMIVKLLSAPSYESAPIPNLKKLNPVDIAVLLYWGFLLISALLSNYKDVAFNGQGVRNDGFIIQTFYVATYFVISRLVRMQKFDLNIYCYGATIVSVLVMLHFFGFDVLDTGFSQPNWESGLLFMGPMGNINLTSYFVTVSLIMAASIYITEQQLGFDKHGNITLACFAVMLWAELNLNTDAGIVAIGAALAVALPLMLVSFKRIGRFFTVLSVALAVVIFNRLAIGSDILGDEFGKLGWLMVAAELVCIGLAVSINDGTLNFNPSRKTLLITTLCIDAAAVLGVLAAAAVAANGESKGILYELGQMLFHGNFNDKFGTKRIFTWKRTLKLVGRHPIFGSGPDSFYNVFNAQYGDEAKEFFNGRNLDKAHNEYLQLLVCSGVTGLGSFLAFLGMMIAGAFKRTQNNPLLVCCAMGVVGYAVHAFFGYSLPINSPLMWVLFGLTGAAMRVKNVEAR